MEEEHVGEEKGDSKPRAKRNPPRISRQCVIDCTEQNVTDNDEEGNDDSVKPRAKKKPRSKRSSEQNDEEGGPQKIAQQHQYNGDDSALEIVTLMDLAKDGKITFENDDTDYQRILKKDITNTDYIVCSGRYKKAGNDAFHKTLDTFLLGYDECPGKKDVDKFVSGLLMNKNKSIRVRFLERYQENRVDYWGNIRLKRIHELVNGLIRKKIAEKKKNTKGKSPNDDSDDMDDDDYS
jgi:hypothetical protein